MRLLRQDGFTLIELMVTISVMAILLAIAVPSFSQFIINNRLTSQINQLVSDISLARSESATRGARIAICTSTDGATCAGAGSWEQGRIVFVDTNNDGAHQTAEPLLKVTEQLSGSNTLALSSGAFFIQFRPYGGLSPAAGVSFHLCSPSSATGKQVAVAATGRPLVTTVACP
jgi:type IV fimbrial biogenesis protein FimT